VVGHARAASSASTRSTRWTASLYSVQIAGS
jgi:hypothetical protein